MAMAYDPHACSNIVRWGPFDTFYNWTLKNASSKDKGLVPSISTLSRSRVLL